MTTPIVGKVIKIDIVHPDGTHEIKDFVTNANGEITPAQFVATTPGNYVINSTFYGDKDYLASVDVDDFVASATVPTAPTITSAVGEDSKVTLTWEAPTNDGGAEPGKEELIAVVDGSRLTYKDADGIWREAVIESKSE
jgi:hypothetical protein